MAPRPRLLAAVTALALFATLAVLAPRSEPARATPVADTNATYAACGRVYPDPHAYWPSPQQSPSRSPWAKGNAECAAFDFVSYAEMIDGMTYLESLLPDFVEFYELEKDFGDGDDCATSTDPQDLCSVGLPRQGVPPARVRSDLYMVRLTDERVANANKRFFVFPLSIHGIERAGAEAGVRIAEDLGTWAYCEAKANGEAVADPTGPAAGATIACDQEAPIPHPILETQPDQSITAGAAMRRSAVYLVFANPDGWRRGDPDNLVRFYQRYNGNGVDMNRDWPTVGFTFRPYTPWSEPETRGFGEVLKSIRGRWDGGIDLHGQLIDDAFSFTLMGASQRDFAKNQRILQTVKGAWRDAEKRLSWSPLIKPNDAAADDPRVYGVQWGTVWDTIDYTVTGAFGDWIDSPLGLGADGIDNEMSLSHISNCGVGSCYLVDAEQLHVDGNKSLVYAMVNYGLRSEDTGFEAPGRIGYVFDPTVLSNDGDEETPPPTEGLPPQDPIMDAMLTPANGFTFEFEVKGPRDDVYNGGLEALATTVNVGGVATGGQTVLVLEQHRTGETDPSDDNGCGEPDDAWHEVNRYYNQSFLYLQSGQAVHANQPIPGRWRVCMTGGVPTQIVANGGYVDVDITFTGEKTWADPAQLPYEVSNMDFFEELAPYVSGGTLVPVGVNRILDGTVDLDRFRSLVIADDMLPGFTEPLSSGPAQDDVTIEPVTKAATTVPCAGDAGSPPTCVADYEFDVDPSFNNQRLIVTLTPQDTEAGDWDLYLQRQYSDTGEWVTIAQSATGTAFERISLQTPPGGHYRVRIVNWAGTQPPQRLEIEFSNQYAGPPRPPNKRTPAEVKAWGTALRLFVQRGGNLVLTDGAIRNLAPIGVIPREKINTFTAYAGFISFTRNGGGPTYGDPLARNVNQPGAAEGPEHRHQTYEPVPIGFAIQDENGADFNASPVWAVDRNAWEEAGGRTAGITGPDQVTLGEVEVGQGVVRVIGPLLPMPSEQYYHPFGLASYALTYSGYQVLNNALQWERPELKCPGHLDEPGRHVVGTPGPDHLGGRFSGRQVLCGLGGADEIIGGSGSDLVIGGAGNDFLRGAFGRDTLLGGDGDDRFDGGHGPGDRCVGGSGRDDFRRCEEVTQ